MFIKQLSPLKIPVSLLFLFLGGCSQPPVKTQLVTLKTAQEANHNQPVAVDLVLVHDRALLPHLKTLSTREWFEKRTQFQEIYRSRLTILPKEVPPNTVESLDVENHRAQGVLLFVNYQTPDHRPPELLDRLKRVTVCLEKTTFGVFDAAKADCYLSSNSTAKASSSFQTDILDQFVVGRDPSSQAIRLLYAPDQAPLSFVMSQRTPQTVTVRLLSATWEGQEQYVYVFPLDDKVREELKNQQRYKEQQEAKEQQKLSQSQAVIQQLTCQRLQQGMTEAEVTKVLGKPWQYGDTLPEAGNFILVYEQVTLLFKNSRLYQVLGKELECHQ